MPKNVLTAIHAAWAVIALLATVLITAVFARTSGSDMVGYLAGAVTAISLSFGAALGAVIAHRMRTQLGLNTRRSLEDEYYEQCQDCQA